MAPRPATNRKKSPAKPFQKAAERHDLGILPEWNLADLYPSIDSPELKRDLDRAESECIAIEKAYKGRLEELAAGAHGGQSLAEPVRRYEAMEDLLGRLMSFASLTYQSNTSDPNIAKFFGDVQERITAISLHLLFFALELNRIDDALIEKAMADPSLGHYRPWIEDLRKEEDSVGYAKRLSHGEIGKGMNDYDAIFTELKGVGFDGWISIEDGVDGFDQLERSVAFLRGKIAKYWPE